MADKKICGVEACGKRTHAHGYCSRHAYHFVNHGDPLKGRFSASPGEPSRWIDEHVEYTGDDCLAWPFEKHEGGYGVITIDGKRTSPSRVMCERAHGAAPSPRMDAAHSCGKGHEACANPRHLSWKTRKQNVADAIQHGTWMHGEMVPNAILTEGDVRKIRELSGTAKQADIAALFGVRESTVSRIINRKRWAWVDG